MLDDPQHSNSSLTDLLIFHATASNILDNTHYGSSCRIVDVGLGAQEKVNSFISRSIVYW